MFIQQITLQECSTEFPKVFDRVLKNHEVISVRNESEQEIVILDAKEYSGLMETLNADRLREGILQHQQGQVREQVTITQC